MLLVTFVSGFRLELMCDVRINLNRKFREASNCYKTVLEAAKLAYATKTRVHHFPESLGTFGELLIVFSKKVSLVYLFY